MGNMIVIRKLVNIVDIVCEVRAKNRSENGACEQNKGKTEVNRTFGTHYG